MVFNRDYDKALWLMMFSDDAKRDEIANLITTTFKLLGNEIEKAMLLYKEYSIMNSSKVGLDKNLIKTYYEYVAGVGLIYWFDLNLDTGTLSLGKKHYDDLFQISIDSNLYMEYKKLKNFRSTFIGEVIYTYENGKTKYNTCDEVYLTKTPIGMMLLNLVYRNNIPIVNFKRVDISNVPRDYTVFDLDIKSKLNRLVKKRTRRKNGA